MDKPFDAMDNYLIGWRDGYAQAISDVEGVLDKQQDGHKQLR